MSNDFSTNLKTKDNPPDIFRAARNNDVDELANALSEGQSLSATSDERFGQTPVHIAAINGSNDFLKLASTHTTYNPWIRDDNERTAFDHADAYANTFGKQLLFESMYGEPSGPDRRFVDTADNEPSEFFPG